ncbi:MAG: hypothetical protein ACRDPY_31255 [Streptosporangiaceae bacterium]
MSDHRPGQPPWHTSGHQHASGLAEAPPHIHTPPGSGRHATPGGPRRPNRAAVRATLIGGGALVLVAGAGLGLALTGSHHPSTSTSSGGTAPTNGPTALSTASPAASSKAAAPGAVRSCPGQLTAWRSTGAGGQFQVVVTDVTILLQAASSLNADLKSGTAPPAAVTALRSAAKSLRSATRGADENVIPACISGAHRAEVAGLAALGGAVAGFDSALSAIGSGNDPAAQTDIGAAITSMQTGSADIARAMVDVNKYGAK